MTADEILKGLENRADGLCSASELPAPAGRRRIDFWTLDPAGRNEAVSYEIKVSRADFRADTPAKQAFALSVSNRFFYVTPPGLVAKGELPDFAGLQEFDGERFITRRRAPRRAYQDPTWLLMASVIRASTRVRRDTRQQTETLNALRRYYDRAERERSETSLYVTALQTKIVELGGNPWPDLTKPGVPAMSSTSSHSEKKVDPALVAALLGA